MFTLMSLLVVAPSSVPLIARTRIVISFQHFIGKTDWLHQRRSYVTFPVLHSLPFVFVQIAFWWIMTSSSLSVGRSSIMQVQLVIVISCTLECSRKAFDGSHLDTQRSKAEEKQNKFSSQQWASSAKTYDSVGEAEQENEHMWLNRCRSQLKAILQSQWLARNHPELAFSRCLCRAGTRNFIPKVFIAPRRRKGSRRTKLRERHGARSIFKHKTNIFLMSKAPTDSLL